MHFQNVGHVVTVAKPSQFEAQLYIFEDNKATIYRTLPKTNQYRETCCETKPKGNTPTLRRRNTSTEMMLNYSMWITSPQTQINPSHFEAMLHMNEDNEAVNQDDSIIGRSQTMRHVSRTHRVALDWLFGRISLDPKIQIKYVDTQNQLADIVKKGSFTREEYHGHLQVVIQPFQLS